MQRRIARAFGFGAAFAAGLALAPLAAGAAPDPWITTRVKLSLLFSEGLSEGVDVNVDTEDGRVTLHGTVATASERTRAEQLARRTQGVRNVRNLIQVVPASLADEVAALDEKIDERVEAALAADPQLDEGRIEVKSVHQGVVLLGGEATSWAAVRAVEIAQGVDGVRRVASDIRSPGRPAEPEIGRNVEATPAPADARAAVNDAWLTSAAKVRLLGANLPAFDVHVETRDGVVTLFGTVDSEAEKREAEAQVKQVDGVSAVRNELQVAPRAGKAAVDRKDEEIRQTVSERLAGRAELSEADIDVKVENGVVRLTGEVESPRDRLAALSAARTSDGVRSVIGDLRVGRN